LAKNDAAVLKVKDLSVSYGHITALRQVSLEVNEGELVALLGANGAGKSTLLAAIVGVVRAGAGSIWFKGQNITWKPTDGIVAAGVSVVPEGRGILPLMSVMENLQLGAYHVKGDIGGRLDWVFDRFPVLGRRKSQPAGTLSGGEQQMLAIARALMASPGLLLMDEPSLGLAPLMVEEVFRILIDLKKEGHTILLAEQNARKALQCADRAYVFQVGSIVLEGATEALARDPRVHQAYLGGL
jgi:branched-chain amino acid transport system ATP-binding protein